MSLSKSIVYASAPWLTKPWRPTCGQHLRNCEPTNPSIVPWHFCLLPVMVFEQLSNRYLLAVVTVLSIVYHLLIVPLQNISIAPILFNLSYLIYVQSPTIKCKHFESYARTIRFRSWLLPTVVNCACLMSATRQLKLSMWLEAIGQIRLIGCAIEWSTTTVLTTIK